MPKLQLTFGSLFSGIGGIDLGFERAGMKCRWMVEIDPFARQVLAKNFPGVCIHDDVRTFPTPATEPVDLICGGFPCQGVSSLNYKAKGLADARSGLFFEFARIIREVSPKLVVVENVPALTFRGMDQVLGTFARMRYDAEWQTISASSMGAPHTRDRIFIVAYPARKQRDAVPIFARIPHQGTKTKQEGRLRFWTGRRQPSPSMPDRIRWCPDSELCGVVNGVPDRLDRYRVLGNAVVPIVAEQIGKRIIEWITETGFEL